MADREELTLLPVRMLNEFAYCPRLFHFMHVEGRWADNVYTVEGKHAHRRVDQIDHLLPGAPESNQPSAFSGQPGPGSDGQTTGGTPEPALRDQPSAFSSQEAEGTDNKPPDGSGDGDDPPVISRSVPLSSDRLGITAKLDLVSTAGDQAVPVETKRGRVPTTPERSYEPERVQLMAQGLLLREHGYRCDHGVLYFAASRTRVDVPFTPELEARTLDLIDQARQAAIRSQMPVPLDDSPKCNGCSLNAICLPDETLALQEVPADPAEPQIRRLYPMRDDALPFYVQEQGATIGKSGETLIVRKGCAELARARLKDVSQLVLCGNVMVSAQAVHLLCEGGIPIVHLSSGNWFYGITSGIGLRNAYDRAAQFSAAARPEACLAFARDIVTAKGANQRTLLRRNADVPQPALADMADLITRVADVTDAEQLLGIEGSIAAVYFRHFGRMLRPRDFDADWDFKTRNRRPPKDPVNSMLSFCYALLTKEATAAILAEGLDPWWGLYHRPRHGRPALSLDLIEPFRAVVADSAVITAVNTGMIQANDFTRTTAACMLNAGGRKALIRAYEGRLDQLVTHPIFEYRCSWRAMIRVQARLLARWFRGDIPEYRSIVTR
jgi:CRISPR-associated protein Cas1